MIPSLTTSVVQFPLVEEKNGIKRQSQCPGFRFIISSMPLKSKDLYYECSGSMFSL